MTERPPQRSISPSVKYTTKELLERIEAKVEPLGDIRSKWGLLMLFLTIAASVVGVGGIWNKARQDALEGQILGLQQRINDMSKQIELHTKEPHPPIKCFAHEDDEQDARLKAIERRLRIHR